MRKGYWFVVMFLCLALVGCGKEKEDVSVDSPVVEEPVHKEEKKEEPVAEKEPVEEEKEEVVEEEPVVEEPVIVNPLTGLAMEERALVKRPVAVTINNLYSALPQSGISEADVIYETLVEGGITRLVAVYKDPVDVEKIGPVRSARRVFLDFTSDLDGVYVHYGQDWSLATTYDKIGIAHLDGQSWLDGIMFWRDSNRVAPHNAYTSGEKIYAGWEAAGYRQEPKEEFAFMYDFIEDGQSFEGTGVANKLTIPYSYYIEPVFTYKEETGLYERYHFNEPHIDETTGETLAMKNIIVQYTNVRLRPGDKDGRLDISMISNGKGYYVTDGKYEEITWEKTAQHASTQYYDASGNKLKINKGKTFICIVPSNRQVIFSEEAN